MAEKGGKRDRAAMVHFAELIAGMLTPGLAALGGGERLV
jgi:hypothetical protein